MPIRVDFSIIYEDGTQSTYFTNVNSTIESVINRAVRDFVQSEKELAKNKGKLVKEIKINPYHGSNGRTISYT